LKKNADFSTCVQIARDYFDKYFNHNIRDLLNLFAHDAKDSHGNPFWSGPKRCPDAEKFDAKNAEHFMFVMSCANLLAYNLGINQVIDDEAVRKMAAATTEKSYVQTKIIVETPEEVKAREARNEPPPTLVSSVDDEAVL
jgi:ubiquitin-activating enzyme E1